MRKIYIITEGDYSDYHIVGVFSTKEKAEKFKKKFKADYTYYEIEEHTLDPIPENIYFENLDLWYVQMWKDGEVRQAIKGVPDYDGRCSINVPNTSGFDAFKWGKRGEEECFWANVWAKDEKHAIKIVNEKRVQYIANGIWGRNGQKIEQK